jgi:hypothetical protein
MVMKVAENGTSLIEDLLVEPEGKENTPTTPVSSPVAESAHSSATPVPQPSTDGAKARAEALVGKLGLPAKTANQRLNVFMAAFVGVKPAEFKAQPADLKMQALEEAEAIVAADLNEFSSGPEEAGKRRRRWRDEIRSYLEVQWPKHPETVVLGCKLARQWNLTPNAFQQWFQSDNVALDFRTQTDSHAILRMLLKTREAAALLKVSKQYGIPLGSKDGADGIIDQIEKRALLCSVEDAPVDQLNKAITAYVLAAKDEFSKPAKSEPSPAVAEPEPVPPAAVEENPEQDNLFSDTW